MQKKSTRTPAISSVTDPRVHIERLIAEKGASVNIIVGDNNTIGFSLDELHGVLANYRRKPSITRHKLTPKPPRAPMDFVGRERELGVLDQNISKKEAIVVYSPDGMGKTALVKKAANGKSAKNLPDGVIYKEALDDTGEELSYPDLVQSLFDGLYESDPQYKVSETAARTRLSNTRPLVVLDRFELPQSDMEKLADMFPKGSVIVATRTQPIGSSSFRSLPLEPLDHADAMQLFAVKSGLNQQNTQIVSLMDQICRLLHDFPLAITVTAELIANKKITPAEALDKLNMFLSNPNYAARSPIQQAYTMMYTLLNKDQQDMLAYTAAAPGISADRAWLERVAGGEATSKSLETLGLLKANSPRLRLAEGLRQIVQSNRSDIHALQNELMTELLNQLKTRVLDLEYLTSELGNILGLMQIAFYKKQWRNTVALGMAVDPYLTVQGFWDAWERVLKMILEAGQNLNDIAVESWALHQLGSRNIGTGDFAQAHKLLVRALKLRESSGDEIGAEFTRHNLRLLTLPPKNDGSDNGGGDIISWIRRGGGQVFLAPIAFAIVAALLYYIFVYLPAHRLDLTITAQQMIHLDSTQDSIRYTYTITNTSAKSVNFPIRIISETAAIENCISTEFSTKQTATLKGGESVTCVVDYPIAPADTDLGMITNRAQAQSDDKILSNSFVLTTPLDKPAPSLLLSVVTDIQSFNHVEQVITYAYTLINRGNTFLDITKLTDDQMDVGCDVLETREDEIMRLSSGNTIRCMGRYTVLQEDIDRGAVVKTAQAIAGEVESNKVTTTTYAEIQPALKLTTTAEPSTYERVGQEITFKYLVENIGNNTLESIPAIRDDHGMNSICSNGASGEFVALPPKSVIECTAKYSINQQDLDAGSLTDRAVAVIGEVISNESTITISANQRPELALTISASPGAYSHPGDVITYTYTVINSGNVTLDPSLLSITDKHPARELTIPCDSNPTPFLPNTTRTCSTTYSIVVTDIDAKSIVSQANAAAAFGEKAVSSPPTSTRIALQCPGLPNGWTTYRVDNEKTLDQITSHYAVAPSVFQDWNCMGSRTNLTPGERIYVPYLVSIRGLVYQSPNRDKTLPGFTITLDNQFGSRIASMVTQADGKYIFSNLLPGYYMVLGVQVMATESVQQDFGIVPLP